ncbi:thioredoxin family protein [Flaviaesturariibacter terrae]
MKRLLFGLLLPLFAGAQQTGIEFTHAASWQEVLQKAKAEHKLIFVDAYTTWCGPCRYLSSEIFPKDEVGKVYNANFISVKMQLDTTAQDNEWVKQWYPTTGRMMHDMHINVFPTLLFFDADGNPVHRVAGAGDAARIIGYARTALDSAQRYYTLKARYDAGARDEATITALTQRAAEAYDLDLARSLFREYMRYQNGAFTLKTAQLADMLASSVNDPAFALIAGNEARFDSVVGQPGAAKNRITDVLMNELMAIANRTKLGPGYKQATDSLKARFGPVVTDLAERARMYHYRNIGDWSHYAPAAIQYLGAATDTKPVELNDIAWAFFEHVTDRAQLEKALGWSKKSLAENDPNFVDTYANLLHKLGRTKEAIEWEEKAMAKVDESQKAPFRANIEKMKKGEKTW